METGAKNGFLVLDDQTVSLLGNIPTSIPIPTILKAHAPMTNRTNAYRGRFPYFINSTDKFLFCGELCLDDAHWKGFIVFFHLLLLVRFVLITIYIDS